MAGRSIASTSNLSSIFLLALCTSVNMVPQIRYIGYRPPYHTIYDISYCECATHEHFAWNGQKIFLKWHHFSLSSWYAIYQTSSQYVISYDMFKDNPGKDGVTSFMVCVGVLLRMEMLFDLLPLQWLTASNRPSLEMLFFTTCVDLRKNCYIIVWFGYTVAHTSRAVTCIATVQNNVMKPHSSPYINKLCW